MRAVVYLRVSTDDQAESGAGLAGQRDACAGFAGRQGWEVVGPFADEGVSGAAGLDKRPALMDAIAEIGEGDVLLVAKRDRLGRDPIVVAMIEAAVSRRSARVVSTAGEGTDSDDPTSVLMRRIVDAFGEYERLVIKARTKAALRAKQRRGERASPTPFGFDLIDDGRRSKRGDLPVKLVVNPAEMAIVGEIRDMADDGMKPAEIARELNERGIPSKTGKLWSNMGVRRILARPRLADAS